MPDFVMCYTINSLKSKITLYATSLGAILNIIIDKVLVVNCNIGVKGAAIATVVSQTIGCYLQCISFIRSQKNRFGI